MSRRRGTAGAVLASAGLGRSRPLARQPILAAAHLFDFAFALQALDDLPQRAAPGVTQLKCVSDFAQADGRVDASQVREQVLVGQFVSRSHGQATLYRLRRNLTATTFSAAPGSIEKENTIRTRPHPSDR